jgi:hypothetical protein
MIDIQPKTPVASRYFLLPVDLPNPDYDARCRKQSFRGTKTFRKDSTVHAVDYEQRYTINGETRVQKTTEYHLIEYWSGPITGAVAEAVSQYDTREQRGPTTLKEAAVEKGVGIDCLCEYAVRQLLADGKLTIDDILADLKAGFAAAK